MRYINDLKVTLQVRDLKVTLQVRESFMKYRGKPTVTLRARTWCEDKFKKPHQLQKEKVIQTDESSRRERQSEPLKYSLCDEKRMSHAKKRSYLPYPERKRSPTSYTFMKGCDIVPYFCVYTMPQT